MVTRILKRQSHVPKAPEPHAEFHQAASHMGSLARPSSSGQGREAGRSAAPWAGASGQQSWEQRPGSWLTVRPSFLPSLLFETHTGLLMHRERLPARPHSFSQCLLKAGYVPGTGKEVGYGWMPGHLRDVCNSACGSVASGTGLCLSGMKQSHDHVCPTVSL